MIMYSNQYTQKVYEIIEPLVGDLMARGTIKTQTAAIGITEETVKKSDIPILAEKIKKGLVIFLGSESAAKIAARISGIS